MREAVFPGVEVVEVAAVKGVAAVTYDHKLESARKLVAQYSEAVG